MFLRFAATLFDVITLLASLVAGWQIWTSVGPDLSAIQSAAGVAFGIGIAVIPYCIAGAFHRGAVRELLMDRNIPKDGQV